MGTVVKTFYDKDVYGSNNSLWTLTFTTSDFVATGQNVTINLPTLIAKYVNSYPNNYKKGGLRLYGDFALIHNVEYAKADMSGGSVESVNWGSGVSANIPVTPSSYTFATDSLFNSSNKTEKDYILNFTIPPTWFWATTEGTGIRGVYNPSTAVTYANLGKITLDAPPTYDKAIAFYNGSYDANGNIYAGITKAYVTVSNVSAKYDGYITSIEVDIGDRHFTRGYDEQYQPPSSQNIIINLAATGSFTPKVTVIDSRGQKSIHEFNEINVLPYDCSVSDLSVVRIDNETFKKDDEGTNAVLKATFSHTHFEGSTLSQPGVEIMGIDEPTIITWYQNWNSTTGIFSNQITNWDNLSSPITLYGKITNNLATENSFIITTTPKTTLNTTGGASLNTTLSQSFYLLVGRPGGHGLGIGTKPPTDDLHVDMNAYFYKDIFMAKMAGVIQMYGGVNPPNGWLICDGRSLLISDYPLLAAALYDSSTSTYIYGAADSTHFNLPDLRGRAPIGAGQGTGLTDRALGTQDIGSETHTLTEAQLPRITGSFILRHWASSTANVIFSTSGKFTTTNVGSDANNVANNSSNPKNAQQVTYAFGGNGAHPNMQPSAVVNFIICTGKTN